MATDEEVRNARAENDKLRQQIADKQAANEQLIEAANNEYRLQRYQRQHDELERQLAVLNDSQVVSIPQPPDETLVFADTVQPDAQPEATTTRAPAKPATNVPSTPTDVATTNPQGV